jgi:hypothetical protein
MNRVLLALAIAASFTMFAPPAQAHCDSKSGPVVSAARVALQQSDVTPVLMWVQAKDEAGIREAFQHALAVRKLGPEARQLADNYFFETLVRVHRAGEGAPYTGLNDGEAIEPGIAAADRSLEDGSAESLIKTAAADAADGIRQRYEAVVAAKAKAGRSIEDGRAYVRAYVEYIHYVKRLHAATSQPAHAAASAEHAH